MNRRTMRSFIRSWRATRRPSRATSHENLIVDRVRLYAIVVLGAALRLFPIWFGLPYLGARPDEETAIGHAVGVLGGDPNPHFFHWPSLTFYLFAGLYAAASLIRRALFLDPALS